MDARERHQPQETVLYRVVREHLETFLRTARERHGGLPKFIERTFRAYLKCGLPEFGFAHVKCGSCGHQNVVAFSCKRRGVCPSCSGRVMGDGAAHLVDHVLPAVPYRQWVFSWPLELGGKLAFQPELLAAVERIATKAMTAWMKARSGGGHAGGVWVRHRFGGSLNLHLHGHVLFLDGSYVTGDDGVLRFQPAPPLTKRDLEEVGETIHPRIMALLKRRGLLKNDDVNNEAQQLDALGACGNLALSQGKRERAGPALGVVDEDDVEHPPEGLVANVAGLNVYASAVLDGNNRELLENACHQPPLWASGYFAGRSRWGG